MIESKAIQIHFKHLLFTYLLTALPHQKENGMFLKIYCITGPISYFIVDCLGNENFIWAKALDGTTETWDT